MLRAASFLALLATLLLATQTQAITWQLCEDVKPYMVDIKEVSLSPDPGQIGTPASFKIRGDLKKDVKAGNVGLEISFSGVPIFATQEDLCAKFAGACPRPAGPVDITIVEALPPIAPPGFYGLRLTAIDDAGNDLMCLNVDFELVLPSAANAKDNNAKQDVKRIDQGRRMIAPPS